MRPSLRTVFGVAALIACLGLVELFVQQRLEHTLRDQLGQVLDATREASVEDVQAYLRVGLRAMTALSRDTEAAASASTCAARQACEPFRAQAAAYLRAGGLEDARIVDPHGKLLASLDGDAAELDAHARGKLGRMSVGAYVIGAALARTNRHCSTRHRSAATSC
jgi:hypothetical protein